MEKKQSSAKRVLSPIADFFESLYFSFTPPIILDYLKSWSLHLFAIIVNLVLLVGFILLCIQTVDSLHNTKYISLAKTSGCSAIVRPVTGTYYLNTNTDINGIGATGYWTNNEGYFSALVVTFTNFERTHREYEEIMTHALDNYYSARIISDDKYYDFAMLFILAGVYGFYDDQGVQYLRLESTGDRRYYFQNSLYKDHSGHLLPNGSFYQFDSGSIVYGIDTGKVSFSPASNDPYADAYIHDFADFSRATVDLSYTLTVLSFNQGFNNANKFTNFYSIVNDPGYAYTYAGKQYFARTRNDPSNPFGYFLCILVPRAACILRYYYLKYAGSVEYDEEFAIPFLRSFSQVKELSGRVFFGLVYYKTFQEAVDALLSYDYNYLYNANVIQFPSYVVIGADYYYNYVIGECGSCTRALVLDIQVNSRFDSFGTRINPYTLIADAWPDYVVKVPPTPLIEKYYECQLSLSEAMLQGVGITAGNIQLAYSILMLFLVPVILYLYHYLPSNQRLSQFMDSKAKQKFYDKLYHLAMSDEISDNVLADAISLRKIAQSVKEDEANMSSHAVVAANEVQMEAKVVEMVNI